MMKVTRRVVPRMVVTAEGVATAETPPPEGVSVTVTLEGMMVPEGKFEPVRLIVVKPGLPVAGDASELSVT